MPTHVDFSMNKTSDIHDLAARLERYNAAYRLGAPEISDAEYDQLTEELRALDPEHPFLQRVEPEEFSGRIEVRHPRPMLSTEKAYTQEELARFVARVRKEAGEIGVEEPLFRVTPWTVWPVVTTAKFSSPSATARSAMRSVHLIKAWCPWAGAVWAWAKWWFPKVILTHLAENLFIRVICGRYRLGDGQ